MEAKKNGTPKMLLGASRQYRHNNNDELVHGFDYDETVKIFARLQEENKRLRNALKKILGWREYDFPDQGHRTAHVLVMIEDTVSEALNVAQGGK